MKILLTFLLLIFTFQFSFAQRNYEISVEQYTYKHPEIYRGSNISVFFDKFSKNELIRFSEKLNLLSNSKLTNWEDKYTVFSETTSEGLIWKKDIGYVSFYIDHCSPELRRIDYGSVLETDSTVEFIPQIEKDSIRKNVKPTKYVKIIWKPKRYLVEESSLLAFAENAAGIYVEPEDTENSTYMKWSNFWEQGDWEKKLVGLPIFPSKYKNLERKPIFSKIISVGKRKINLEKINDRIMNSEVIYPVNIDAGENKGVKAGMRFFSTDLGEWIIVKKVFAKTSATFLERDFSENKVELCSNSENQTIACKTIKKGMKVKTKLDNNLFY